MLPIPTIAKLVAAMPIELAVWAALTTTSRLERAVLPHWSWSGRYRPVGIDHGTYPYCSPRPIATWCDLIGPHFQFKFKN
jgi:hypothetical protein